MGRNKAKAADQRARAVVLAFVGKKGNDKPQAVVRKLMKAGKVKQKCCRSRGRCQRCPVLALRAAKSLAA
ncbi:MULTISPECIES: hypothetical protein [Amycolatopsis]|uniref:Uncharacterized protein n=1 Tax=Amycolatopsis albidoflavus TaxID=102226 RepID=A0ABW5I7S2_9PSEU